MTASNDFVNHVSELLGAAGNVVTKRMFGGHGVYIDGLFVAIVAWDELYLKVDDLTKAAFEAKSCTPFVYTKDGRQMTMSYRRAPDDAMDAPQLMLPWARLAIEAALRSRSVKAAVKRKPAARTKSARPAGKKHNGP
jgi:DNA transformation protein and related proteins